MSILLNNVNAGYDGFALQNISAELPDGGLVALIGPNGCGKSTLLKTMAGQLSPGGGRVQIGGLDLARASQRQIAQQIAMLPQHPIVPPAITVEELVAYGRAPHQNFLGLRSAEDNRQIAAALDTVALTDSAGTAVSALSGGQRQRAFVAMALAQDTPYILLDEPTSFLDIRYQYEVLDLMQSLAASGKTVIAVLHDIAQAARYARSVIVMKDGHIHSEGAPEQIITANTIADIWGVKAKIYPDPVSATPVVTPL